MAYVSRVKVGWKAINVESHQQSSYHWTKRAATTVLRGVDYAATLWKPRGDLLLRARNAINAIGFHKLDADIFTSGSWDRLDILPNRELFSARKRNNMTPMAPKSDKPFSIYLVRSSLLDEKLKPLGVFSSRTSGGEVVVNLGGRLYNIQISILPSDVKDGPQYQFSLNRISSADTQEVIFTQAFSARDLFRMQVWGHRLGLVAIAN